jgi:hypothetical protein
MKARHQSRSRSRQVRENRLCDALARWRAGWAGGWAQVCLWHHSKLCKCHPSRHVLFFRHTIHELEGLTAHCRCATTHSLVYGCG